MQTIQPKLSDEQLSVVMESCARTPLNEAQRNLLDALDLTAAERQALIHDVKEMRAAHARDLPLERHPFSITQIADDIAHVMQPRAAEKGLEFSIDAEDAAECYYSGDGKRVQRIIMALCDNAVRYTDEGGVDVVMTAIPGGKHKTETLCVTVEDSGIGISDEDIGIIFQPFTQMENVVNAARPRAGMGLAYAKTMAEAMGGSITVTSDVDFGSTFELRIPLHLATYQDNDKEEDAPAESAVEQKPCVLLVEDYEANVLVATSFLEHFGYAVDVAICGHDAVAMIKKKSYIAVLMDVKMPDISGFDATKLVRAHEAANNLPPAHIIGMTAYTMMGARDHCIDQGMDDYISKPFSPDVLKEKLNSVLRKRTLRQF